MSTILREGELEFDFSAAVSAERFDVQGQPQPHGWKAVDFVIEEPTRLLLVEVKDPAATATPEDARVEYLRRLGSDELISQNLVPKARDTYAFLHLMKRDTKPCVFVVLFGLEPLEPALLLTFKDRLVSRLGHEAARPWRREYTSGAVVLTPSLWGQHFEAYPLRRLAP